MLGYIISIGSVEPTPSLIITQPVQELANTCILTNSLGLLNVTKNNKNTSGFLTG